MKIRRKAHEAEKSGVVIKRTKMGGGRDRESGQWKENVWYEPQHHHGSSTPLCHCFIHTLLDWMAGNTEKGLGMNRHVNTKTQLCVCVCLSVCLCDYRE